MDAGHQNPISAGELAERFGAIVLGNPKVRIARFASLANARPGEASFLSHPRYRDQLTATKASVVVVANAAGAQQLGVACTLIQADDPYLFFAKAASWLLQRHRASAVPETVVHPSAVVEAGVVLGQRVRVSAGVVISAGDTLDTSPGACRCLMRMQRVLCLHLFRVRRLSHDSGRSSAWLERYVRDVEVAGSNPVAPTSLTV